MEIRDTGDISRLMRAARVRLGWSQQQAADAAGISRRLVNQLEGGQHPNAELWRVLALLSALGVPLHAAEATEAREEATRADDLDLDAHLDMFRSGRAQA